ncbi:MAG: chemotaxis protein CheD [Spirochaetaceae bacterium]|nr:chemotaxis protein CheD [Spirochaetaceae bacterium]
MTYTKASHLERVTVHPGERYATNKPYLIATLLGSCVAACLYDLDAGVGGLNHFLLAAPRYSKDMPITHTDAGRYGINAMELLINDMVHLGADRRRLKAKVFGGASVISGPRDNFLCIHEVNQRFIREYLATEKIPLVSEDLGGERGRLVYFHTDTFQVFRRYMQKNQLGSVEANEHDLWKARIEKPEREEGEILLF